MKDIERKRGTQQFQRAPCDHQAKGTYTHPYNTNHALLNPHYPGIPCSLQMGIVLSCNDDQKDVLI